MINNTKILDCTLRDGGYYTNWDFDKELVGNYCKLMETLPIDYIEVGYRSIPLKGYLGKYFYCPVYILKDLKELMPSKKLVIILNEKDIRPEHLEEVLAPCKSYIKLVRIAIDPKNFERAIILAKAVKSMGFEVGFNVMYMSEWLEDSSFLELLTGLDEVIDYFYMVDSFGGLSPDEVINIIDLVKSKTNVPLGFHGHNNLEMALINTITSIKKGCSIVDSTITGMGRGAGNLRTELLLIYLNSKEKFNINYSLLGNVVSDFESLKKTYNWGTNLPYMFSGAYSLPQKQVMEWVGKNRYPISSIITALNNQKDDIADNIKLPSLSKESNFKTALILGGGKSALNHSEAIMKVADSDDTTCVIHAGGRNVLEYLNIKSEQYYTLVGFESEKLLTNIGSDVSKLKNTCVFPPFPRAMGTIIPDSIKHLSKELEAINFTAVSSDSLLAISLQLAIDLGVSKILLSGFDGYDTEIDQAQFALAQENQNILNDIIKVKDISVQAITPTKYKNIKVTSIYNMLK
ncbi:MAG: aldolase catalytic domain-containing protein [Algibacter sp.]|uniref:aldolase catalytic domain-containing protein n=1 Tax=Algibacter sp. TaxID=1872428 RepID=UPI003298B13C